MSTDVDITYTNRGFACFGEPLTARSGYRLRVQESSSAEKLAAWLFVSRDAPTIDDIGVHMTVPQASALIDDLEGACEGVDTDYGHHLSVLSGPDAVRLVIQKGEPRFGGELPACDVRVALTPDEVDALKDRLGTFVEMVTL